jgi:Protein of unknown function (DUF3106)
MAIGRLVGGLIAGVALATANAAEPPASVIIGTPPQPGWSALGPQHKVMLAPLAGEWDKMDNVRRKKWLGIAERYPAMTPDEQRRTQDRMREWASLTSEQRAKARGSYKDFNRLPSEQQQAVKQKWEAYSNLPPEERQRVRETGKSSRLLTPLPAAEESAVAPTAADSGTTPPASPPTGEPPRN